MIDGLDLAAVATFLRERGLSDARSVHASLISGGRSNLTYHLNVDDARWVLRRPPTGETLATAHDMRREHDVMSALAHTGVPVPRMVCFCEDPTVLGTPFYIMERVEGQCLRDLADVAAIDEERRRALVLELVDTLATLHLVDPSQVGLARFGRPEGYLARQVRRWRRQLEATLTPTTEMARLADTLAARLPAHSTAAIVHGDFRLDNCLVDDGRISAVLDWEMSTLGDPLSDLALFAVYHDGLVDHPNPVVQAPGHLPGCPRLPELLHRYATATGLEIHAFDWYLAFAWFKLAVILAGVAHRAEHGQTAGQQFVGVTELITPCVENGLASLETAAR